MVHYIKILDYIIWLIDYVDGVRRTSQNRGHQRAFHGNDDADWGKLLSRLPELSGNPTSRVIWQRAGGTDEGEKILAFEYLRYLKKSLTYRKLLRRGASGFTSHLKEGVLRILSPLKIQRLSRVSTREHRDQWQAHQLLHHRGDYYITLIKFVLQSPHKNSNSTSASQVIHKSLRNQRFIS
jgi:hypothetical protein